MSMSPCPSSFSSSKRDRSRFQPRPGSVVTFDLLRYVLDPAVVRTFLQSIGLPCEPFVVARARSPTLFEEPAPDYDAA
jgi:hypothetical protein